MLDERMVNLDP